MKRKYSNRPYLVKSSASPLQEDVVITIGDKLSETIHLTHGILTEVERHKNNAKWLKIYLLQDFWLRFFPLLASCFVDLLLYEISFFPLPFELGSLYVYVNYTYLFLNSTHRNAPAKSAPRHYTSYTVILNI